MKIKYLIKRLLTVIVVFCFSCKQVKDDSVFNNSTLKTEVATTIKDQPVYSDSLPCWDELKLGSNYILNNFPKDWSYPSIFSDDYDEAFKNKFSKHLEEIKSSYSLTKTKQDLFPINISELKLIIEDKDFGVLNYQLNLKTNNLYQLYKLNESFCVGVFKQEYNKPINNISKRVDLVVFDRQFEIIDKANILLEGNGDQHAFMKYFYISNGIIQTRSFYVYDGESSATLVSKFEITSKGEITDL